MLLITHLKYKPENLVREYYVGCYYIVHVSSL